MRLRVISVNEKYYPQVYISNSWKYIHSKLNSYASSALAGMGYLTMEQAIRACERFENNTKEEVVWTKESPGP